jgi:hypothetical protein
MFVDTAHQFVFRRCHIDRVLECFHHLNEYLLQLREVYEEEHMPLPAYLNVTDSARFLYPLYGPRVR